MPNLDRDTARALADAGYMPLSEYIRMFGDEPITEAPSQATVAIGDHRSRAWEVPPRLSSPAHAGRYWRHSKRDTAA